MSNPLVSIITVSYNSEETIEKTILSILNQTYTNIEYIIIDGASNDLTISIIEKYKKNISKFISEIDKGIYDAFNKGLDCVNGDFVQIVNSDDILEKNKIKHCVEYMQKHHSADVLIGDLLMFDSNEKVYEKLIGAPPNYWNNFYMGTLNHPTFFVRSKIYRMIKFRRLKISGDFDWVLRAIHNKCRFEKIDNNIVYMRDNGISTVSLIEVLNENLIVSLNNGSNKFLTIIFYLFTILKRTSFIIINKFLPNIFLYLFKPNKKFLNNKYLENIL